VVTAAPMMERFSTIFADEHRRVRDLLLDLVALFQVGDQARARATLAELAAVSGPHFRYEEESLYPALVPLFGDDYIEKLFGDHDGVIASARHLVELAAADRLTPDEVADAVRLVRSMLPHVSDCDGLTIMVEVLPPGAVESVLGARDAAREENLDLLSWASAVRSRPVGTASA